MTTPDPTTEIPVSLGDDPEVKEEILDLADTVAQIAVSSRK